MSSRMLRSGIRSEILDPSRHGTFLRNKKEIMDGELVQYHQYLKCISFARARLPGALAALHAKRSAIGELTER